MKTDRSGRTLQEYRQLYWDGKERIKELEAENHLMAAHQGIDNYQRCLDRINELQAKLDAVKDCERYSVLPGGPPIWMLTKDVLKAIGEQE